MEPSFVANPYVQASAPTSRKIRETLDREEASYEAWRKARKPVRLPHASLKLNKPFEPPQAKPIRKSSQDATYLRVQNNHSFVDRMARKIVKRKDALVTGDFTRSMVVPPSTADDQDTRQKQMQFSQASDVPRKQSEGGGTPSIVPHKTLQRGFQEYLYDFHSRVVFSCAKNELEESEDVMSRDNVQNLRDALDEYLCEGETNQDIPTERENNSSEHDPQVERHECQSDYLLIGLGFLSESDYDAIFETDWKASEVEKTVRDAVDRKRIHELLRRAYRMLLWFFRYYAGNAAYAIASERRTGPGAMLTLGEGLFEIPSRLRLLDDLNIQCVDATRFGVTDVPLKREGLIDFLLNVAKMMCTHASNPIRLKMTIDDGIEMSEAVKTLVHEHFGAFAQIQDVDHFRTLFLRKLDGKLHAIIEIHKLYLANLFDELVSFGTIARSGGGATEKGKGQLRQRRNGISCAQFLATLRAISLITTGGTTVAAVTQNTDGEEPGKVPVGVDEVRAVRIFLSCLPLTTIDESGGAGTNGISHTGPREMTLSQFVEALLRVAFTWKEIQICCGRFDVCPNQMTSDCCRCTLDPGRYAFDIFTDAVEDIFMRIQGYLLKRAQHRTSMRLKSMNVKSHRSLHALVAMTTVHRAPTRVLLVDSKVANYDAAA